jgi:outer membrane protein TolC
MARFRRTRRGEWRGRSLAVLGFMCCSMLLGFSSLYAAQPDQNDMPESRVWKVQDAVHFGLKNNPDSKVALSRIDAARAAVAMEKAAFYPELSIQSRYGQTNTPMYSFGNILNQGAYDRSIDFNNPGRTDNLNVSVRLAYTIFNGWRNEAGLTAAEAQTAASQMELAAVQGRLAFELVRAFNQIGQAEELVRAHQAGVAAIAASLDVARARETEGLMLRADLLDLEVQHAQTLENLSQARHGLALAKRVFLVLLGVEAEDVLIEVVDAEEQVVPLDMDYSQRPELMGLDAMIRAAQARVRQAHGGDYPAVEGYAGYGVDQGYIMDSSGDSWEAGVRLQYNLFDGHRTSARVAQASALLAEARQQKRKTELAIGLEVQQAHLALQLARERLLITEKTVDQALESARINRERFHEGVGLASDMIGVENRLTWARVRRAVALHSEKTAVADLRRALGVPQFTQVASVPSTQDLPSMNAD